MAEEKERGEREDVSGEVPAERGGRERGAVPWTRIVRKIDDYRWEIPRDYKPGMRVPGLVFADEHMLRQIGEEQALEQVANAATLPGIVGYSLAMPDIHWGYGFPVGGVAAFDLDEGIISPGGTGYDINCLAKGSRILHQFGYQRSIEEFEQFWVTERIKCVNPHTEVRDTKINVFLKQSARAPVLKALTESRRRIEATADHPFLTPSGMVPLRDLERGARISVYPFEGILYDAPSTEGLVTKEQVSNAYPGHVNGLQQLLRVLRRKRLLPLSMDHPKLPYLIKLLGFVQGDGNVQLARTGAEVKFYGTPDDLERVRSDILALGFRPSRIFSRGRSHIIRSRYGSRRFEHMEHHTRTQSAAFAVLLKCLGATVGNKAAQDWDAPGWLDRAPRWMKRLYLAAYFGAELTSPQTVTDHPYSFYAPVLSVNKRESRLQSGWRFIEHLRTWLAEFGVESSTLTSRSENVTRDGETSIRLRLQISSRPENLIRLWSTIGFEYNRRKQFLANVAVQYLRLKTQVLGERTRSIETARALSAAGFAPRAIAARIGSRYVDRSFVARSLRNRPRSRVRIGKAFPDFWTFLRERTEGLGETGQVWDTITSIEPVAYDGPVYDFTVADPNHNFIANSFVVSNCGVRLIRTHLTEDDVRPHLDQIVDVLFHAVPSGVGATGRLKLEASRLDQALKDGARWAVAQGYGRREDLETCEAGGALPQADPAKVSPQAKSRGKAQVGTLGSGNHFLEIQVVDQIFDTVAAETLGLAPGQIVVFVHCGSRGLGHQVCTDYLRVSERANTQKYHIHLVDRQLACVPFRSPEGQDYFGAMCAAANFAWANRQLITHWVREGFARVFGRSDRDLGMDLVYDVCHNIAKVEEYEVNGKPTPVCVHRKGATRAFPAGHPEVPDRYRAIGQPVLIPGDMGRYSFIAVGTAQAMVASFGSTCHGAGRVMGRKAAVRALRGVDVADDLRQRGIVVRATDRSLLAEEASPAYKDVADVVDVCHHAGLSRRVARTRPIGVVKG